MAEYFSHDYGSRNDPKLIKLQMDMGHEGKGIFWDLVEILYEQGGYIKTEDLKTVAFSLKVDLEKVEKVIKNYKLFEKNDEKVYSKAVLLRLKKRNEINNKRKNAAKKRHILKTVNTTSANAEQMQSKCRANDMQKGGVVKSSKGKSSKGKSSKEKKESTTTTLVLDKPKPVHVQFVDGWKERYREKTKLDYRDGSAAYVNASRMIKKFGIEQVCLKGNILADFCEGRSVWFTKDGWASFTIEKLISRWNELLPKENEKINREEYWLKRILENDKVSQSLSEK
jgi:hypothetical protein